MAGNTTKRVATDQGQARPASKGRWPAVLTPKRTVAILIVAAALWFILVNRATIGVYLWVPKVTAPLWLILLFTFAGGLLTGLLLSRSRKTKD